jgi:hypothetical protein
MEHILRLSSDSLEGFTPKNITSESLGSSVLRSNIQIQGPFVANTVKQRVMQRVDADYMNIRYFFKREVRQWRKDVGASSFLGDIISHPSYQRIISKGMIVVPQILLEFAKKPWEYWSHALSLITGHSVGSSIPYEEIQEKWIAWGKSNGLVEKNAFDRIQKIHKQRKLRYPG